MLCEERSPSRLLLSKSWHGSVDILNNEVDPAPVKISLRVGTVSSMAEVSLVRFARVALGVAESVLPDYRTEFSKRTFTQPQLLAVLCLMRYEDWTLRKAEVRLAKHGELRSALGSRKAPDHTTLYRFLRRLDERALVAALNETILMSA